MRRVLNLVLDTEDFMTDLYDQSVFNCSRQFFNLDLEQRCLLVYEYFLAKLAE